MLRLMNWNVTHSSLECGLANALSFFSFHRIIEDDTSSENMEFSWSKDVIPRQKCAVRVAERVRKAEAKDDAAANGEASHDYKKPKPSRAPIDTFHV